MLRKSKDGYTDRTPRKRWSRLAEEPRVRVMLSDAIPEGSPKSPGVLFTLEDLIKHVSAPGEPLTEGELSDAWGLAMGEIQELTAASSGHVTNIEESALENEDFRRVIYTGENMQLVLMSLKPGESIGEEVHDDLSQFFRIEAGEAKVTLGEDEHEVSAAFSVIVPEGMSHNVENTGDSDLKLYSIYTPPQHPEGTVHKTKDDAEEAENHSEEAR